MTKAAVIGLGSMGAGMASSLGAAGIEVIGYEVDEARRAAYSSGGGRLALTPAEAAASSDVIFIVVVNAAQTRHVLLQEGVLESAKPGGVILSCATMAPQDARDIAATVQDRGLHFLDAPLSGGAARAANGELTVLASGPPQAFERAEVVLAAVATKVYRLGEAAGEASAYKAVNQLLAGIHIAAASEAIVFAQKLGLDIRKVYEVITGSAGNSWMFENRIPHVLDGDYAPRSATEIFVKDLGIATDIGRSERYPMPLTATALQMFLATSAMGFGRDDDSSVARLFAQLSGVDLPGVAAS